MDINARFDVLKTKSNPAGAIVSTSETEFRYESEEEEDEEVQIRKLIEWDKDVAHFDPSPDASDDEDDHRRKPAKFLFCFLFS